MVMHLLYRTDFSKQGKMTEKQKRTSDILIFVLPFVFHPPYTMHRIVNIFRMMIDWVMAFVEMYVVAAVVCGGDVM